MKLSGSHGGGVAERKGRLGSSPPSNAEGKYRKGGEAISSARHSAGGGKGHPVIFF